MPDPNVQAAKGDTSFLADYRASIAMGLLPIALKSEHPTIIYRWNVEHIIAPMKVLVGSSWREGIWVDAWVWALFHMRGAMNVFTNAWTTVQENKPKILELKILYDAALKDPEQRLLLLTELRLSLATKRVADDTYISLQASIARVQAELDKREG